MFKNCEKILKCIQIYPPPLFCVLVSIIEELRSNVYAAYSDTESELSRQM